MRAFVIIEIPQWVCACHAMIHHSMFGSLVQSGSVPVQCLLVWGPPPHLHLSPLATCAVLPPPRQSAATTAHQRTQLQTSYLLLPSLPHPLACKGCVREINYRDCDKLQALWGRTLVFGRQDCRREICEKVTNKPSPWILLLIQLTICC